MSEARLLPAPGRATPGGVRAFRRFLQELREALAQAAGSLLSHKLRAALTLAGVAIGVATVIGIETVVEGLDSSFAAQLSALGPHTLYVHKFAWFSSGNTWWKYRNRPLIGPADFHALQAQARLPLAIAPVAFTQATVALGDRELKSIQVRGTVESFLDTGGWQVKRGRFISQIDEDLGTDACVVGADLEDAFFHDREAIGQRLTVGPVARCTVVGTLVRKGNAFGQSQDTLVVLPLSAFSRSFGSKRGLTIAVVAPAEKVFETEEEIVQVLRAARRLGPDQEDNFSVNRQDRILQTFGETTRGLRLVAGLVGVITLIVGGIGIMNILLVSVKERTREIGVRRALGARRSTILLQFLCEAVAVSALGGAAGTALGTFAAWIAAQVTPLGAAVSAQVVLLGVAFSFGTGLVFGVWPALSAALLHPIEALRHE